MNIDKRAYLDRLNSLATYLKDNGAIVSAGVIVMLRDELETGCFDVPSGSNHLSALHQIANDAGTDRVREAIENIEDEMCDDFSLRAQRINKQLHDLRDVLGIALPEGNEPIYK